MQLMVLGENIMVKFKTFQSAKVTNSKASGKAIEMRVLNL